MNKHKQQYLDFEAYERVAEPHKRERASVWRTAIGLQDVDGLKVSDYLKETAVRHIEGDITIDDVREQLKSYYVNKTTHDEDDAEKEEADGRAADIMMALRYDIQQEKDFNYKGLNTDEIIDHIVDFVTLLWQNHPFREGNTRTTAVFVIKYLRSIGFKVDNDLFADNSWYFRNALVRANYRNPSKGIEPNKSFLIKFFRNLLMGEDHELKNRYMLVGYNDVDATSASTHTSTHASTHTSTYENTHTSSDSSVSILSENIKRLLVTIGTGEKSVKEMMEAVGLKNRPNFLEYSLSPAITEGLVKMKYPNSPRHPRQKYLLTVKGLMVYDDCLKSKRKI